MDLKKLRRKLQRHKAAVKYDASGSFSLSISSSSSSSSSSGGRSSIYIQSMKFYDRNSIRIEGTEGEFNMICRGLGLSGPEDFAIPAAAWKAMQVPSSSDMVPRLKLGRPKEGQEETEEQKPKQDDVAEGGLGEKREDRVRVGDEPAETSGCCAESGGGGVCGGIKGVRPPMLPPPPGMRVPVVDDMCSIWDLVRGFAPQGEGHSLSEGERRMRASTWDGGFAPQGEGHSLSDSEDKQGGEEEEGGEVGGGGGVSPKREEEEEGMDNAATLAEIVAESKEDDSSSTTTGPRSKHISPNSRIKRITTNWQKGELLGRGSLGSVYEGISEDGFFFAMKEVSLLDQGNQGKQRAYQLQQEIALWSQFEHKNIVQYYGTEMDESNLYLFLELVTKGSLASLYRRYTLQDSQVSAYTRQILYGLKYLHDRNVVHRDIKCANILVDANGSVKLADFGLAKAIKLNDVKSCQGGAFWMAPEVVKGKNQGYGLPADMWSLGCTVLEMLTGEIPYFELEWMQALFRIGKGERPPVPDSLSRDARDFILQCLQVNPDDRPTAAQLLNHPFIERPLSQS